MTYAVEMSSGAMIYIPRFINTGSGIQNVMGGGGYIDTQRGRRSHKVTLEKYPKKYYIT
jgi:hypothetical protein